MLFAGITPRFRVVLSLILISTSMSLLVLMYFILQSSWVGWVYVAYMCGGIAIGSFESNLLSTITPLGPNTKMWAIIGMPVGFTVLYICKRSKFPFHFHNTRTVHICHWVCSDGNIWNISGVFVYYHCNSECISHRNLACQNSNSTEL